MPTPTLSLARIPLASSPAYPLMVPSPLSTAALRARAPYLQGFPPVRPHSVSPIPVRPCGLRLITHHLRFHHILITCRYDRFPILVPVQSFAFCLQPPAVGRTVAPTSPHCSQCYLSAPAEISCTAEPTLEKAYSYSRSPVLWSLQSFRSLWATALGPVLPSPPAPPLISLPSPRHTLSS